MKKKVISTLHYIHPRLLKPYKKAKNLYTRYIYKNVINDLKIYKNENYEYLGHYLTIKKKMPRNYTKKLKDYVFDDFGINKYYYNGKYYYNPIQIAQYGLTEYGYYLESSNTVHKEKAEKVGQWLLENQNSDNGLWYFNFAYYEKSVSHMLEAPWCSAMAQGQAMSLLCRLYSISKNNRHKKACDLAMKSFELPVDQGGVLQTFQGNAVYEEYPTNPPSYTLNGFIYSLFGLYDVYKTFDNKEAKRLFDDGVNSLKYILPLYDDSNLTYYNLSHFTAPSKSPNQNSKYHILHIKLLQNLNSVNPDKVFSFYINKWKSI